MNEGTNAGQAGVSAEPIPRVSVGLPVHNGDRYLEQSIRSVLDQTFTDLELIICDNASTDRTEEICQRFAALDARVRYHRNPRDIGAQGNHQRVFELSRGPYFKWAAHDDAIAPGFIERCVEVLNRDDRYVLAFTRFDVIDSDGVVVGLGNPPPEFAYAKAHRRLRAFWHAPRVHQTVFGVIRRDALARTALMGDWYGSDRTLLIDLAMIGGFARIDEVLFHHREHLGRSHYESNKQLFWAPDTARRPELGHWKRLKHAARQIVQRDLPWPERIRVFAEYVRHGASRIRHWVPHLLGELFAAVGYLRVRRGA